MATPQQGLLFLVDENAPQSVINSLREQGYGVHTIKQSTFEGEPDEVVAKLGHVLSDETGQQVAIVTFNHKHFARIVSRRTPNNQLRYRNLGRISLLCSYPTATKRLRETFEDIEREFLLLQQRANKRLIMSIDEFDFRIER